MITVLKKYKFFIFCVLLFVFLRLPSLFEPYWYGDEGIYLVLGQAIRKGLTLYTQIHDNKPPTLYYLAALAQTVFGFRLLLAISMAGAYYFFYKLSQKFLSFNLARLSFILFLILTSIPLIEGNIANAEVFMLLPTLISFYYFYSSLRITNYVLLITGLLLGMAFTIKIPVIVEFVFICFWLLITTKKNIVLRITDYGLLITGFITPFLIYLIYFFQQGAVSDFIFASILQNFGYLSSWQTGSHSGGATNSGLISRVIILVIFYLFTFILYRKQVVSRNITFLILWFSATIFGALLSTRPYPHYLIQVSPPFVLLLVSLLEKKLIRFIRFFIIFLFFVFSLLIFKYKFYVYPVFSYYQNFYSYIINQKSYVNYQKYFSNNISDTYNIANYVKSNTSPNEKIFIWGDEPYIYALSNRLPVGRFTVAYHVVDFNQYQSTYDQLLINFPKIIIYFTQSNRPFSQLDQFIKSYYTPDSVVGGATIYLRNDQ